MRKTTLLYTTALVALAATPTMGAAQGAQAIDVPAQPLAAAIAELGEETGLQIVAAQDLIAGVRAEAVSGLMTPTDALRRMVAGAPLRVDRVGENSVIVQAQARADVSAATVALPQITVTGERLTRTRQETTSSVSVLTEEEISRTGEDRLLDAFRGAPNVAPSTGGSLPNIRGVVSQGPGGGLFGPIQGNQRRAPLIVDGTPRINNVANVSNRSLLDVEQVEVLRGPQSTTRGANAIAGAFVVESKAPTFDYEGEFGTTFTWNKFSGINTNIQAVGNLPIVEDQVATRFAFEGRKGEIDSKIAVVNGAKVESIEEYQDAYLRSKWLIEPEKLVDLSVELQGEYYIGVGADPGFVNTRAQTGLPVEDRYILDSNILYQNTQGMTFGGSIDYALNDSVAIQTQTTWQRESTDQNDQARPNANLDQFDKSNWYQDVNFIYDNKDSIVNGVVGFSFAEDQQRVVASAGANFNTEIDTISNGLSGFFDGSIALTSDFRILAGARVEKFRSQSRIKRDFPGTPFAGQETVLDDDITERVFLPKLGLQYDVSDDHVIAFVAQRAYNPGSANVNITGLTNPLNNNLALTFDSEFSNNYEISYRGDFLGSRLNVGANAFYTTTNDKQFRLQPDVNTQITVNLDKSRAYGFEADASARVLDDLSVSGAVGVLETKIVDAGETAASVDGNDFGQDPALTLSGSVVWSPIENLELYGDALFISEYHSDFNNTSGQEAGAYANLDVGASYVYGPATVRLFVNNVFDSFQVTNESAAVQNVLPPRTIGLSGKVSF